MRAIVIVLLSLQLAAACSPPASAPMPPPKSIDELRAEDRDVELTLVQEIDGGAGFNAFLFSYKSAGLTVHALVAVPDTPLPEGGFPVLVANHGHHPDPPQYGITAEGKDWRPGDYYRRVPELFAAAGFMVVMPDFRGHNNSEGVEFTEGMLESSYYTEDVLNLLAGLPTLPLADPDKVFMWGHSMGGEVTLRALLATNRVRAASMWSSVGGDIWDQAYYYSRYKDPMAPDSSDTPKSVIERLRGRLAEFDGGFDYSVAEPMLHLDYLQTPIIVQHAVGDRGAAYKWSERLAKDLYMHDKQYQFYSYAGDDHLFKGKDFEIAVDRDAKFFRSILARPSD